MTVWLASSLWKLLSIGLLYKPHPNNPSDTKVLCMTKIMKVLGAKVHGDYKVLEFQDIDQPQLLPDDVLIEVHYTDVNPVDLQKLAGRPDQNGKPVVDPPHVPGYGGSGVIVDLGAQVVSTFSKGQAVCFLADPSRQGSYAEYIAVNQNCVATIPTDVNSKKQNVGLMLMEAACIPVAGLAAYESLMKCDISNKKSLLVVGGSGGVGSWTVTLAKVMNSDIRVFATCSGYPQDCWIRSLGASEVFPHSEIEKHLQGGREGSVDAIVCLTEPTPDRFAALSNVIKPYGTICLVVAGNSIESLNLGFCFFKCVNVVTETVFSSIRTNYSTINPGEEMGKIIKWMAPAKSIKAPLSPDMVKSDDVSIKFSDALSDKGALKALSQTQGKMGKFVMNIKE